MTDFDHDTDLPITSSMLKTTSLERNSTLAQLTIEDLLIETQQYLTCQEVEAIQRAYEMANKAHNGAVRRSGGPFIQHPLAVALLLAGVRIDVDSIIAALLHDVVEDTSASLEDLETQFGPAVANIVDGVTKVKAVTGSSTSSPAVDKRRQRTASVHKMFMAMAEDPRVVVLKLADRLHNMRTLGAMTSTQQQNIARETYEIYAPLARRLGMYSVYTELEDLAFRYLEPEKYAEVVYKVQEELKRRHPYIEQVLHILHEEMKRAGIHAKVQLYIKHLANINRKLEDMPRQKNGNEMSQIYDIISFHISVDTGPDCYLALRHIHALWRPKDGGIQDYIANPKLNGYQSLDTTVFCLDDRLAQIQIRTHDMQRIADYGIASYYWYLRERGRRQQEHMDTDVATFNSRHLSYQEIVTWMKQLREWQHALPQNASSDDFVKAVKDDIFQEQIFVFTPKGDVKDLPCGSTPLDMAYRIHTDIGEHCEGARIITTTDNSLVTRLVPPDYELKGGEIVNIIVNDTVHPTRDWLSFAHTAAARVKIRRYLKMHEREMNLELGRERLDMALKTAGMLGLDEHAEELLHQMISASDSAALKKCAILDDVYVALGREDLHVESVIAQILPSQQQQGAHFLYGDMVVEGETKQYQQKEHSSAKDRRREHLAHCCCPIPGDPIIGILSPNKGMQVHRSDCCRLLRRRAAGNTQVTVNWLQIERDSYLAPITIIAHDRNGLLYDVAEVVADSDVSFTAVSSLANPSLQKAVITATLEIARDRGVLNQFERILQRLRQVKSVVSVERALSTK